MVIEGTLPKTQIEPVGLQHDPSMIDTKADLKEQFSKLTQSRQPKPGPGSYLIPGTFKTTTKPVE